MNITEDERKEKEGAVIKEWIHGTHAELCGFSRTMCGMNSHIKTLTLLEVYEGTVVDGEQTFRSSLVEVLAKYQRLISITDKALTQ